MLVTMRRVVPAALTTVQLQTPIFLNPEVGCGFHVILKETVKTEICCVPWWKYGGNKTDNFSPVVNIWLLCIFWSLLLELRCSMSDQIVMLFKISRWLGSSVFLMWSLLKRSAIYVCSNSFGRGMKCDCIQQ